MRMHQKRPWKCLEYFTWTGRTYSLTVYWNLSASVHVILLKHVSMLYTGIFYITVYIYIYTVREQESMAVLIAKIGTIFVPRTLPHRRILFQRSLQRPQACSLLWPGPHRDAVYGRDRTGTFITIWPGPHQDRADTLIYGRDRTETLFTMAGTAPGRSLLWPGPHRDTHYYGRDRTGTALTHSLLWPGPHWDALYYGRDRTGTLIAMAGTDTPFGPYKVI